MAYVSREPYLSRKSRTGLDAIPARSLRDVSLGLILGGVLVAGILRLVTLPNTPLDFHEAGYALDAWRLHTGEGEPGAYLRAAPGYTQLLSVMMFVFGASDLSARLLSVLAGAGVVLLCLPLGRALGRNAAAVISLLFALSPFWIRASGTVTPEMPAVFLAVFALALLVSRHLWPWSLLATAAAAGYLLAFGTPGVWLSAGLLAALIWIPRRYWKPSTAAGALGALAIAAGAGFTAFYTRSLRSPWSGPEAGSQLATVAELARDVLLTAPVYLLVLAAALFLAITLRSAPRPLRSWYPEASLACASLVAAMGLFLPSPYKASPAVVLFPVTLLAGVLLSRAVAQLLRRELVPWAAAGCVLVVCALAAPGLAGTPSHAFVPGGVASVDRPRPVLREALDRVQRVSLELYSLERSLEEPRGGRKLEAQVAPSLGNWGLWYLRELESVRVAQRSGGPPAEVVVTPGTGAVERRGYVQERLGSGDGAVTLAWRNNVWQQINPSAGSDVPASKDKYDLFDAAPPGDRPGQLNTPVDIAMDPAGNYYVVDQGNGRLQKYDRTGKFLMQWGSKGNGDGQFADMGRFLGPTGILATREYVWVTDTWNHRIQQFRSDGLFVRAWGSFKDTKGTREGNTADPEAFYGPRGIALGPDGLLYITDTGNKRIVVYKQNGDFVRQWGAGGAGPGELDEPVGIAVDTRGTVYVADARNHRIQVFTSRGVPVRRWTVDGWTAEGRTEPYVDVDASGNVYVTDPSGPAVLKYSPKGQELASYSGDEAQPLLAPIGLAVSPRGEVTVVDGGLSNVLHLDRLR